MTAWISRLNAPAILVALSVSLGLTVVALANQGGAAAGAVTQDQVQEALTGIAQAGGYNDLVAAISRSKSVLGSPRAQALFNERLRASAPDDATGRRLLTILGQLFADVAKETPETAANRYLIRLIAMGAMTTGDSDQLQRLLLRYYEFAARFTPDLIKPALEVPRIDWPLAMPRLMAQFVEDWRGMGANEASRSFADALHAAIDDPTGAQARSRDESLVGQWYSTQRGLSGQPEDTNLILTKSGVARTYVSTGGPEDFEGIAAGRWVTAAGALTITWDDGEFTSGSYELSNGQLQWSALGVKIWVRR